MRPIRLAVCCMLAGCSGEQRPGSAMFGNNRPDEHPVMVNKDLPFRYPAPLSSSSKRP
jgi:hypothetical protein